MEFSKKFYNLVFRQFFCWYTNSFRLSTVCILNIFHWKVSKVRNLKILNSFSSFLYKLIYANIELLRLELHRRNWETPTKLYCFSGNISEKIHSHCYHHFLIFDNLFLTEKLFNNDAVFGGQFSLHSIHRTWWTIVCDTPYWYSNFCIWIQFTSNVQRSEYSFLCESLNVHL